MSAAIEWAPSPPHLSDKIADWTVLAEGGGEALIKGRIVVDVGPLYCVDALMFEPAAARYHVLDISSSVLSHAVRVTPMAHKHWLDVATARWTFADGAVDTVIDFSTFDDTADPMACYREAGRVLRPGGTLVTTYANALVARPTEPVAMQVPDELAAAIEAMGFCVRVRMREDQARAGLVADKILQPSKEKTTP